MKHIFIVETADDVYLSPRDIDMLTDCIESNTLARLESKEAFARSICNQTSAIRGVYSLYQLDLSRSPDQLGSAGESKPAQGLMTKQQALDKARELWGEAASVYDRAEHPDISWNQRVGLKWVGCTGFKDIHNKWIYGNGGTWEQAFEEAAERQKAMVR